MAFLLLVLPFLEPVVNQRHELLERPTLSIPPGQEKLCDFPDKRGRCRTPFVVRSLQYSRRVGGFRREVQGRPITNGKHKSP